MLTAVIIDYESNSIETISSYLSIYCPDVELVGTATGIHEGLTVLDEKNPDLLFLDIMMGDGSGFDLLESCHQKSFSVIFVTAYERFAIKAFQYSAVDYLLKPIEGLLLQQAVEKASKNNEGVKKTLEVLKENKRELKKLAIPTTNSVEMISLSDIVRLEANGNYTNIFTKSGKYVASRTLKEYDSILSGSSFFRVHKSHLINLDKILRYVQGEGGYVVMDGGASIEVARRRKEGLLDVLTHL
jgi:two-component system LytT family response regulator